MITYPITLPCPKVSGHTESFANNFTRSNLEYASTQEFISQDTIKFNFTIVIKHHLYDEFMAFFDSLYGGIMPFTTTWTIANQDNVTAKFINGYSIKNIGALYFEISANMEVI